jgi:hypothetical protein
MRTRVGAGLVALVVSSLVWAVPTVDAAGAAKRPKSCTLLTAKQISKVLNADVTGPNGAGTLDIACDYDVGPGLGEPGGGLFIVQYYEKGPVGSTVFAQMKKGLEGYRDPGTRIPGTPVWWDGADAWLKKKGQVVTVGASYTNNDPPPEASQDEFVELVQLAGKKL